MAMNNSIAINGTLLVVNENTNKGKPLLELNGFRYQIDKKTNDTIYWACVKKYAKEGYCKSRLVTSDIENGKCLITKQSSDHNHNAKIASEESKLCTKKRIVDAVSKCKYLQTSIIMNKMHATNEELYDLPTNNVLKGKINYQKRKMYPKQPTSFDEITMNHIDVQTASEENFLLHSSRDRFILIFGTINNVIMMCKSDHWMADGTFKVVPSLYEQLFTIFALIHDAYYPMLFVLLKDKKQSSYEDMLNEIIKICLANEIDPPVRFVIHLDFEIASSNAFTRVFPQCVISRCLFHLTQSIFRRVVSCGLKDLYITNQPFRDCIKMLAALSFLPPNEVTEAFQSLKENMCPEAQDIYNYFQATYVTGTLKYTTRSGIEIRNTPLFPPTEWNSHSNTINRVQRSNNIQEGWHNRMRILCIKMHPTLGYFIETLLQEHSHVVATMKKHLQNALIPPKRNKMDKDRDNRLFLLVQKYNSQIINQEELLIGIVGNIELDD